MKPDFPKLKIKIKSLAYEAQAIRKEERATVRVRVEDGIAPPRFAIRLKNPRGSSLGDDLYFHRTLDVRKEQRATLIAYGFLRGVPYAALEQGGYQPDGDREQPNWGRVREMAEKYGPYGYTKTERAQAWADIVAWRAVPALPRENLIRAAVAVAGIAALLG
jgi:hypothetical protein